MAVPVMNKSLQWQLVLFKITEFTQNTITSKKLLLTVVRGHHDQTQSCPTAFLIIFLS